MKLSEAVAKVMGASSFDELPEELKRFAKSTGSVSRPLVLDEASFMKALGVVGEGISDFNPTRDAQIQQLVDGFFSGLVLAKPPPRLRADGVDLYGPELQPEALAEAKKTLAEGLLEFLNGGGTVAAAGAFCAELKTIVSGGPVKAHVFRLAQLIDEALDDGLEEVRRRFASMASRAGEYAALELEAAAGRSHAEWKQAVEAAERAGHTGSKAITKAKQDNPALYERVTALSQRSKR